MHREARVAFVQTGMYLLGNMGLGFIFFTVLVARSSVLSMAPDSLHRCVELETVKKSVLVPYVETYRRRWGPFSKIEQRINYKITYVTSSQERYVCCHGYEEINSVCIATCSTPCTNGVCVEPDVCRCSDGYAVAYRNVCVPECSNTCLNGNCVAPNVCECSPGYRLDPDGFTCSPICAGNCERENGVCLSPGVCGCPFGFRRSDDHDGLRSDLGNATSDPEGAFACVPVCESNCSFGKCTAPNVCVCHDGYRRVDDAFCEPICEKRCVNGRCVAPETCDCIDGFGLADNSTHFCKPICTKECVNGRCVAPEICDCHEGFGLQGNWTHLCQPICEKGCVNGRCVAPETCDCIDGYRPVHQAPLIDKPLAVMDNGYKSTTNAITTTATITTTTTRASFVCEPICELDCVNGSCARPNACVCNDGYRFSKNSWNLCEPDCGALCQSHSRCVAPNVCRCDLGYEPLENETSACRPVCRDTCVHGNCVEPDRCVCEDGYAPLPDNATYCEPHCEGGCENGDCVAPGVCRCPPGRVPSAFHAGRTIACALPCTRNCSDHGACRRRNHHHDESCDCRPGWTGPYCERPSFCAYVISWNENSVLGITVRNASNGTLLEAYNNAPSCYHCDDYLDNRTLCLAIESDQSNANVTVGCLLPTDSPCYTRVERIVSTSTAIATAPLIAVVVLLVIGSTAGAYFAFRRHQRRKLATGHMQTSFLQASAGTESLLSEESVFL